MKSVRTSTFYRLGIALAIGTALFLVWLGVGVGIIGADGDPANVVYAGVLGLGLILALATRFRASGLVVALIAMAIAQGLVTVGALITGAGQPASPPAELIGLNGGFIILWIIAALLFRKAADQNRNPTTA